jgi:hypothetical protein
MEFPLVSAAKVQTKKHRVREIVVSAFQGQPGNTDFEAVSTKSNISLARCFFHLFIFSMTKKWKHNVKNVLGFIPISLLI